MTRPAERFEAVDASEVSSHSSGTRAVSSGRAGAPAAHGNRRPGRNRFTHPRRHPERPTLRQAATRETADPSATDCCARADTSEPDPPRAHPSDLQGPADLRGLDEVQLAQLAVEIRETIIRTVAETGGHLGSSLGVVELTIALHRLLESPRDRIVWDTGHQAYPHKLLTGRLERFATLRQLDGVGGFPRRSESPHDVFDGGHAGTGLSIAEGLAEARDLRHGTGAHRGRRR